MRTFEKLLVLGIFISTCGFGSVFAADSVGPRIEFTDIVQELGDVGPKSNHEFDFHFKNTGNEKLVISNIQSTCGCTVPELEKRVYEPGEEGSIKVKYEAPSKEGPTTKKIYVHSNDSLNKRLGLMIKSNTVLKVEASPKRFELVLIEENAGMGPITVKSKDGVEFSIVDIDNPGKAVFIQYDPALKAAEHILKPVVSIEKLKTNLDGLIKIRLDHPECKEVLVSYTALAEFEVAPARILFLKAEPGATEEREIFVKANYTDSLEIESVTSKKGHISVVSQENKDSMVKLNVVFTAPEVTGKQRFFADSLFIKIKDGQELEVKCSGWFKSDIF